MPNAPLTISRALSGSTRSARSGTRAGTRPPGSRPAATSAAPPARRGRRSIRQPLAIRTMPPRGRPPRRVLAERPAGQQQASASRIASASIAQISSRSARLMPQLSASALPPLAFSTTVSRASVRERNTLRTGIVGIDGHVDAREDLQIERRPQHLDGGVGRAVRDDDHVELLVAQREQRADALDDALLLVVRRARRSSRRAPAASASGRPSPPSGRAAPARASPARRGR